MPKKQIVGSIILLIILSFICMFIYNQFKDRKYDKKTSLIVEKKDNSLIKFYTDSNNQNYYLYNIEKIIVDYQDRTLELGKALDLKQITLSEVKDMISNKNIKTYEDGSSLIYNDNLSLLQCNTIDGNKDYYFGPGNDNYKEGFCKEKPYIESFIKSYLVLDISNEDEKNSTYITLKEDTNDEVVSVKIDNSFTEKMLEDELYQFKFGSLGNNEYNDIASIFKNNILLEIIN